MTFIVCEVLAAIALAFYMGYLVGEYRAFTSGA
jgi:hypothetical protein